MSDKVKAAKEKSLEHVARDLGINIKSDGKTFECCPVCGSGKGKNGTPGCHINKKNNTWKCFSCDNGGSTIDLVKVKRNLNFKDAVEWINKSNGHIPPYIPQVNKVITSNLQKKIKAIEGNNKQPAIEYLLTRNINSNQLQPNSFFYDTYTKAICFIDSNRKLLNKRGIENSKKLNEKGSVIKNALYDKNYKPDQDIVFLVESPIDALSSPERSFLAIFSTGNKFSDSKKLKNYIDNKVVVLAFDPDKAGQRCAEYYTDFLSSERFCLKALQSLSLPTGKDINDLCKENALEDFLEDSGNYINIISEKLDPVQSPIDPYSQDPDEDFKLFRYYKSDGCYFTRYHKGKAVIEDRISNFVMQFLFHFNDGTKNSPWLIKIQRYTGELVIIEVQSSELKYEAFTTILTSHNCSFIGNAQILRSIFMHLQDQHEEAFTISTLGYSKTHDAYFLSDCLVDNKNQLQKVDELGIIRTNGKTFYLPAFSKSNLENKEYTEARKFRYKPGDINFNEWSNLLYTAYGVKGSIGICFLINAIFRDIVFDSLNFFPYMFLFGEAGVGKTSFIDFLLRIFGDKDIGISIKTSSTKGVIRALSQKFNACLYFKEYDSTVSRERDKIALLKNGYDGAGYTIAQKSTDNKTDSFYIECALIIDGNVQPTSESALYDRMIVLIFEKDSFTQQERKAYKELIDQSEKGLSQVLKEILSTRQLFKENYKSVSRSIYEELKDDELEFNKFRINSLPERTIKHIAFLLTPYKILQDKLSFPFSFEELLEQILIDAIQKSEQLNDLKDVNIFWDAVSWDRQKDFPQIKENEHFVVDDFKRILYITIQKVFPVYMEYCMKNNIQYVDRNTLISLLTTRKQGYIKNDQNDGKSQYNKKGLGRCYRYAFENTGDKRRILINGKEITL